MPYRVAVVFHEGIEAAEIHGLGQAFLHILIKQLAQCQQPGVMQLPFRIRNPLAGRFHNDGQTVFSA